MTSADGRCSYCGQSGHLGVCPMVKAIEFYETGMVKRVEFKVATDYLPAYTMPAFHIDPPPISIPIPTCEHGDLRDLS